MCVCGVMKSENDVDMRCLHVNNVACTRQLKYRPLRNSDTKTVCCCSRLFGQVALNIEQCVPVYRMTISANN